jgi:hypothetical protein
MSAILNVDDMIWGELLGERGFDRDSRLDQIDEIDVNDRQPGGLGSVWFGSDFERLEPSQKLDENERTKVRSSVIG